MKLSKAGNVRTLIESCIIYLGPLCILHFQRTHLPARIIGQGVLLITLFCPCWCAVRLRSKRDVKKRLLHDALTAILLSILLFGMSLVIFPLVNWSPVFGEEYFGMNLIPLTIAGAGFIFLMVRGFGETVAWWNRTRRRHFHLGLTHAVIMMIVVIMSGLSLVFTVNLLRTSTPDRFIPETFTANLIVRILLTITPALGIFVILTMALVLAGLPVFGIFFYFASRSLVSRIQTLAQISRRFRDGDYKVRASVEGKDEVAQLQVDFNTMAYNLEQSLQALEEERDQVNELLNVRREWMARISHELRTPVATVRAILESSSSTLDSEVLQPLMHEIHRLEIYLDDLFVLAKSEAEGFTLRIENTDVLALVSRILDTMRSFAWQSGRINLHIEHSDGPTQALADNTRLEQILVNLIRNGIRHTPPGGIVSVLLKDTGNDICITVEDTGDGIDPEVLPHIWESFYRGTKAVAKDTSGGGLGLPLVKEWIEAMNGSVKVESVPGEGSKFTLRLPKAPT